MLCLSVDKTISGRLWRFFCPATTQLKTWDFAPKMISDPAWPELSSLRNVCADRLVGLRFITGGGGEVVFKRGW